LATTLYGDTGYASLSAVVELPRHFPGIVDNEERPAVRANDCELAAIAASARKEATGMPDQIIDTVTAHSIYP
jgi:hypothetical protein